MMVTPSSNLGEIKTIGEIAFVRGGKRLPAGETFADNQTDYPYIRVTNFDGYTVNIDGVKYLKPETFQRLQRYAISSQDVYISIAGTIGIVGIVPQSLDGSILTENAAKIVIRPEYEDYVDKHYIMYFLASSMGKIQIASRTNAAGQPKLALMRIETITLPLPDVDTQHRIVTRIETLLKELGEMRNLLADIRENTNRLMDAILDDTFMKSGFLADGWEYSNLSSLVEIQYGRGLTAIQRDSTGSVIVYGSGGQVGTHNEALTKGETLIIGRKGSVGAIYHSNNPCWPIDTTYFIDEFASNIEPRFLYWFLSSLDYQQLDRSAAIPGIRREDLYQIRIPLPRFANPDRSLEIQRSIVSKIENFAQEIEEMRLININNHAELDQLEQSILAQAFRGEL